jgi:S-adenosyl methyltransferase
MKGDAPLTSKSQKDPQGPGQPDDRGDWRRTFRPDIPSPARIYDYLLGGKDNYPADRWAGDEIAAHLPNAREAFDWKPHIFAASGALCS